MNKHIVGAAALAFAGAAFGITLENDSLSIVFGGADQGFAVERIVNREVGAAEFVKAGGKADLWKLDFACRGADGQFEHLVIDNREPSGERSVETKGDTTYFRFKGLDLGGEKGVVDVAAYVKLAEGRGASEWRLAVRNRSAKWALFETSYPILNSVAEAGAADWFLPRSNLGGSWQKAYVQEPSKQDYVCNSPGWRPPVTSIHRGEAGLLYGAFDAGMRMKRLVISKDRDVYFRTVVENAGLVGEAAEGPKFAVTIAALKGDWWATAKYYRDWAMQQDWVKRGPVKNRADFPKSLVDTDLLFRMNEPDELGMSNTVIRLKKVFPDQKLTVHWYCWTAVPYCTCFPEFFPCKDKVKSVVRFAKKQGVRLIPYVDPRLWDTELVSWEYAKHDACLKADGKYDIENYWPNHPLAVMCPTTPIFEHAAVKMTEDAIRTNTVACGVGCGFDGVYHDQAACSRGIECWAKNHDHPKGGGTWWADGYRKAFRRIHDYAAKEGAMVLSEGTGDMIQDSVDGYLKASGVREDEVPFYPAVYAGYAFYFGNYESLMDKIEMFRAYQMRDFTCGVILGWLDRWNVSFDQFKPQQDVLRMCARVRRQAEDFMIYGTLEDTVRFIGEVPSYTGIMETIWHKYDYHYTLPQVTGNVWKTIDGGATGVVLANASGRSETVRFKVPATGLKLQRLEGVPEGAAYSETEGIATLVLPPVSAVFLRN